MYGVCTSMFECVHDVPCNYFLSGIVQSKRPVFLGEAGWPAQQRKIWLALVQQCWVNEPVKGTLGAAWDFQVSKNSSFKEQRRDPGAQPSETPHNTCSHHLAWRCEESSRTLLPMWNCLICLVILASCFPDCVLETSALSPLLYRFPAERPAVADLSFLTE